MSFVDLPAEIVPFCIRHPADCAAMRAVCRRFSSIRGTFRVRIGVDMGIVEEADDENIHFVSFITPIFIVNGSPLYCPLQYQVGHKRVKKYLMWYAWAIDASGDDELIPLAVSFEQNLARIFAGRSEVMVLRHNTGPTIAYTSVTSLSKILATWPPSDYIDIMW